MHRPRRARGLGGSRLRGELLFPSCHRPVVIIDSRLSGTRLRAELDRFRAIVRLDLGAKLYLAAASTGEVMYLDGEQPITAKPS